tara:strand:+ start:787 stop:1575 length:789 start_codon:yes stop_codon:yes gene_type:complete
MKNYKYIETTKTLNSRINFNNKFGNFNLLKFIDKKFKIQAGQKILDLGCGDGRYCKLFLKKIKSSGHLIALDKNLELINNLKKKDKIKKKNFSIIRRNFDAKWGIKTKIDWFFSIYAIQYTKNFQNLLKKIINISKHNTKLVFIAPGKENSKQLNELHYLIFNKRPATLYVDRMKFLETNVLKILKKNLKNKKISITKHNYKIKFPSPISYAEYYWSTPVWTDIAIKLSKKEVLLKKKKTLTTIKDKNFSVLKKQTVCVYCR